MSRIVRDALEQHTFDNFFSGSREPIASNNIRPFRVRASKSKLSTGGVVAFTGVVAGNFATGESVPPAVTLLVSSLGGASTATQKSQHSKQGATSKASGPQIFSIPVFLTVSEPVPRRKLLG